ncbi:MAG: SDR family NAD(P)-dependent oxidoreductase [Candidatus Azambacteria bacterium]|nr:SDR family NAD(P)-dependent oxidoreductase [Candidatus Azambacteria bacterium]
MTIEESVKEIKKKYKKAIVTGGAGFIGSHICEELASRGCQVLSIDNYSAGKKINLEHLKKYKNFQEVNCDVTDLKKLKKYFKGVDLIFHNAASKKNICLKDPRRDLEVNAIGTFNMLDLVRKFKVKKFVHASTGSVYGERVESPQTENHPLNPVSYYGVSKLAGEKYVWLFYKLFGLDTTILRYFHVYGPRQEFNEFGGVAAIFVRNLLEGKTPVIFGSGKQERSFTYVKDVVAANFLAAIKPQSKGEVYNCASGINITINELCQAVLKYFGKKNVKPIYEDWLVGDIKSFQIDNSKIKKLGLKFQTNFYQQLEETIKETKEYIENAQKGSPKK